VGHNVVINRRLAIDPGRALDVHEHVAATALGDQFEHRRLAAADVVDRGGAGVEHLTCHTGREGVGEHRHARLGREALDRRDQLRGLVVGRDRRPAARRDGADVEEVEAGLDQSQAIGDCLIGRSAASAGEERVVGDVDDPGSQRPVELERAVGESPCGHPV
jgi:hypothetical protein